MIFKCDFSKITLDQMAAINAVQTLFHQQGQECVVSSLKPITMEIKGNLTETQIERLLQKRVPYVACGWIGEVEEDTLVIQKAEKKVPAKRGRKPRDQGNRDIQQSPRAEMA